MPQKHEHHHIRKRFSIMNILSAIPFLLATATNAIPTIPAAAAPTQIPSPTPTTTASTYTVTKISSTTLTTSSPVLHISPHILSLITTMTVTTYEPWPAFFASDMDVDMDMEMDSVATTVLETVVSSATWVERRRYLDVTNMRVAGGEEEELERGGSEEETTITSFVVTMENTWVVHPVPAAAPTDIFLATGAAVGCCGCSLPAPSAPIPEPTFTRASSRNTVQEEVAKPKADNMGLGEDPMCESTGLATGCQGQCVWKPSFPIPNQLQKINDTATTATNTTAATAATGLGTFWCLHIHPYHYSDPSLRMGRACWGSYLRYRQLNAPCLVGDVGMACLPCVKGGDGGVGRKDESWDAVFWEGEE
ncbi:hypothetical protein SMACR_09352 [Sordaria macrospora]|uniref:WGS project CABT00000000 data, contig 2.87 n=2 Tax=Sordaria macrospora TaxID=5147 RepID=F7WBW6_SORMK|nr:uncharacterized protein SMAC_09352 [Sordaria macrospora k-hell]KAA8624290.1 hypothetical protein SMACR_09352 [Sordaria macrospora]WPJ66150.1 hypothetical protein SMAC4_09352 [Sordaria macrospora]CCC14495.1 unnamed protein product [Sordaria macrospora k-hell]